MFDGVKKIMPGHFLIELEQKLSRIDVTGSRLYC